MEEPTTPSAALSYHLEKAGITAYQLAKVTMLKASRISEILAGKRRITPETATILGAHFGTGHEYWMSIQSEYDVNRSLYNQGVRSEGRGDLSIGGWQIRCYVTTDEARLISERDMHRMLGINSAQTGRQRLGDLLDNPLLRGPRFVDLRKKVLNPVKIIENDGSVVFAQEGEVLIDFCRALLDLRRTLVLPKWAEPYAETAEMLVSSFAKVGIAALIDEATGYQTKRHKEALQRLLDNYFRKEYAQWSKCFPDWFYEELFRLKRWKWNEVSSRRPPVVGKVTKDIVYSRLEAGVVEQLERLNPIQENGRRKVKHHQWLTQEIGHPALDTHFYALKGLMRAHVDYEKFYHTLQLAFPMRNECVQLELDDYAVENRSQT